VELPFEVAWIAGGTGRSVTWNGFPLMRRIIRNVIRMTKSSTGIVQATLLTMNLSIGEEGDYRVFRFEKGQGAWRPALFL
jgi:hypothetical protein